MAVDLAPISHSPSLKKNLFTANEFLRIKAEGYSFPRLEFAELHKENELLKVKSSMLSIDGAINVRRASSLCNDILQFFAENEETFEYLPTLLQRIYYTTDIVDTVNAVINEKGIIRDDASDELQAIRSRIASVKRQINRNFNKVLKELKSKGWLAETNEAFLNERRVLSVMSSYKRQVKGRAVGTSKTGSWSFIEPDVNIPLNFELDQLIDDEQIEIRRILTELTANLSGHSGVIAGYQEVLVQLDFINAKTRLAVELDACLPGINEDQKLELFDAMHPLLLLTNQKAGIPTMPQSIMMDKFSRFLVISGPNAGGKSISLKTVGLLQIMLQSGLLVPVAPESSMCFFQQVLTDIGDNQSIENQLSTYSYRLKRMKYFLEVANKRTLLLLDEFGTGSDPDLGGALAEVFFEELYNRKSFGVITTHYSNIKTKAAHLRNAVNGCMLFDQESLEPLFKLSIGQPGSSFTFEVAEINGIDKDLIEAAKGKLDSRKVKLDAMIAELQKEKGKVERLNKQMLDAERKSKQAEERYDKLRVRFEERLESQQRLVDANNQLLTKGKKMNQFIKLYNTGGGNRPLMDEIRKYLGVEKTKIEESNKKARLIEKSKTKRKKRKQRKENLAKIEVGSTVKLRTGRERGTVLELGDGKALVAFGVFKTSVEVHKLEHVK